MSKQLDIIRAELEANLQEVGANLDSVKHEIQAFLTKIEPDLELAIAQKDLKSLEYLRARLEGKITDAALQVINDNRQVVIMTIITSLRVIVKLATGV